MSGKRGGEEIAAPDPKSARTPPAASAGMGSAAPANGSSGIPTSDRPATYMEGNSMKFKKVHRVYTYGYSFNINEVDVPKVATENKVKSYLMETPFCRLPWDKPYFYMTPSEWHLLPSTAAVSNCNVRVKFRNCRQSFQTNVSSTTTATLNQYQDIVTLVGANMDHDVVDGKFSGAFAHTKMRYPTFTVHDKADHIKLAQQMWGAKENAADFTSIYPKSGIGLPILINSYMALYTDDANPELAGWAMLNQSMNVFDGDLAAGQYILDVNYAPSMGFLKSPPSSILRPYPGFVDKTAGSTITFSLPMANKILYSARGEFILSKARTGGLTTVQSREAETREGSSTAFDYYDTFDKSQISQIADGSNIYPHSQPSIHIGVMPFKSASAKNLVTDVEEYTDMQAYFEVEATCTVNFTFPTRYPHALRPNVHPANQILFHTNSEVEEGMSLICGLKRYKKRGVIPGETLPEES
ncbi:hypothetical protein JTE90_003414 [Oedothorax gibbosus]|uniref:Capsid protein n=2 Tax=Oedothorax gibbosus TaxID=931172 RepID=A0AAV6TZX1_9ARAC|nr:hypothetical protein JTE90_003414 [Oedothorax gibbosus]